MSATRSERSSPAGAEPGPPASGLRVAIVGCGRMGRERATAATALGARVVALCDPDPARVSGLASRFPGALVRDDAVDLDWLSVDAIFVCTPPFARGLVEAAALAAGVPVFVEKPVGVTACQLEPALAALRRHRVVTAVGYHNRYRPSVDHARSLLASRKAIGASCHWICMPYRVPWWNHLELSGGGLNEMATHLVDLGRYLLGDIDVVHAWADAGDGGGPAPSFMATLRWADGLLGTMLYSCRAHDQDIGLTVHTEVGPIRLVGWDFDLHLPDGIVRGNVGGERSAIYAPEVAAFFEAIRRRDPAAVRTDLEDGVRTQRVVDALARSARLGGVAQAVGAGDGSRAA